MKRFMRDMAKLWPAFALIIAGAVSQHGSWWVIAGGLLAVVSGVALALRNEFTDRLIAENAAVWRANTHLNDALTRSTARLRLLDKGTT